MASKSNATSQLASYRGIVVMPAPCGDGPMALAVVGNDVSISKKTLKWGGTGVVRGK